MAASPPSPTTEASRGARVVAPRSDGPSNQDSITRTARLILRASRPRQWVKNAFVVVPAGFGGALGPSPLLHVVAAVAAFCLVSSGLYLANDIVDREADRMHERKRNRPIASGALSVGVARWAAVAALVLGMLLSFVAAPLAAAVVAAYVLSTLSYTYGLKHVVILDVLLIASGFVLRVLGGAAAAHVVPSEWLLLCIMFLALFLGFGKRRHELSALGVQANVHRRVLDDYSEEALDQFLGATMLGTLLTYVLYTLLSPTAIHHRWLVATIPFAAYSVFRYMLLTETRSEGGAPEELLLSDRPLQLATLLWTGVATAALYLNLPVPHFS